jgi:hypothetical protein
MVVCTSALREQRPTVRVKLTRDHLAASGSMTQQGRIFLQRQRRFSKAENVARYLHMLQRTISGTVLILWDGSPLQRAKAMQTFLASQEGTQVHVEGVPGDAPELKPQEQVWKNLLTRRELTHLCCQDFAHMEHELVRTRERLCHQRTLLQHWFASALDKISSFSTKAIIDLNRRKERRQTSSRSKEG